MTEKESLQIKPGQWIEVYDSCWQRSVREKVVRVMKSNPIYKTVYIYSVRKNWGGYDERLSTPNDIKRIFKRKPKRMYDRTVN